MSEAFGAMLRRLRQARTMVAPIQPGNPSSRLVERVLSQNELAHRAEIDPGYVNRLERERPAAGQASPHVPRREMVEALGRALELAEADACRLLVSAGYWPWPDDPERTERALAAAEIAGAS